MPHIALLSFNSAYLQVALRYDFATLVFLAIACAASSLRAEEVEKPPAPGRNAAIHYWRAFYLFSERERKSPATVEAESEFRQYRNPGLALALFSDDDRELLELHRGAECRSCDWALDYEDGISMSLEHLGPAMNVAELALDRSYSRALKGRYEEAVDDILDTMTLARHVAGDSPLGCLLRGVQIERLAIGTACIELQKFDRAAIDRLQAGLSKLPKASSLRQIVELGERRMSFNSISAEQRKNPFVRFMLYELELAYDEAAAIIELPRNEFDQRAAQFNKKLEWATPLTGELMFDLVGARNAYDRHELHCRMLLAAIDVVRDGPEAIKKHRDPYGEGPFEYVKLDDGFELRSKRIDPYLDKPQSLRIGPPEPEEN